MNWFLIALTAPFLWSIVNHTDKYLLSKYFKGGGIGALIIYSSLSGVFVLPLSLLINKSVLIPLTSALFLALGGFIYSFSILLYFYALFDDEASVVTPFFQLIPIFGFIFGYLILGELLTVEQIIASLIIIAGAIILSFDVSNSSHWLFKTRLVLVMLISTLLLALSDTIFKKIALEEPFWVTAFWNYVGYVIFGLIIFIGVKKYRLEFIDTFRKKRGPILLVSVGSEIITIVGNLLFNFATLLAPIAIVFTINAYQPIFVFLIAILLTIFAPQIVEENLSRRHLTQKILAIILVVIGSYILYN